MGNEEGLNHWAQLAIADEPELHAFISNEAGSCRENPFHSMKRNHGADEQPGEHRIAMIR